MWKYIVKDITDALRYLPFGIVAGVLIAIVLRGLNRRRCERDKAPLRTVALTCFFAYAVIILCITLFSRESGSRKGIDLELWSTWGINARNNAFVIENVLLFVPYGFLCAWNFKPLKKLIPCVFAGACSSLFIETIQLLTQRGYFQIDDILTNTLGALSGYLLFWLMHCIHETR